MTTTATEPHPRNANYRWPRYVKLAAHDLDKIDARPRTDAKMRRILSVLADKFPNEMGPILAKADGGVNALRQRLNHMHIRGYENEHPDNWSDLGQQRATLTRAGWPL